MGVEFLLIAVVALLAFLCVTGEVKSFKGRRQASAKRVKNSIP